MKTISPSKNGLTLIEVLVALVIITVGISSMMMAMTHVLALVSSARKFEVVRGLLQQVIIENPIDKETIEEGSGSGSFSDNENYTWYREVLLVDEEERPGLFLVTTRVQWSERGKDSFDETISYVYAPDAESITGAP